MRIVGVVVEPCDWKNSPFAQLKVLPKDGKAIPEWTNENVAYVNVVEELRRLLSRPTKATASPALTPPAEETTAAPGRQYRVKQDFDAIQKAEFAEHAFQAIARYFEQTCSEMHGANDHLRAKFHTMSAPAFTCTVVNRAKMRGGEGHITVHLNRGRNGFGNISWVWQAHGDDGSSNGNLTVEADDYALHLAGSTEGHGLGGRGSKRARPRPPSSSGTPSCNTLELSWPTNYRLLAACECCISFNSLR